MKIVKEHYLRDDIYCGLDCSICPSQQVVLSQPRATKTYRSHFIIPDTNFLYHQIDLIEHKAFINVILLQTVLEELRHKSLSIYNRVRLLVTDSERRFYVFCNEHHRDTYVKGLAGESPNDRNDRAIRMAVAWYSEHMNSTITAVLVTDDTDNRAKATSEGLNACSVVRYIEQLTEFPELIDMVSASTDEQLELSQSFKYDPHLSATQISAGLKSGAHFQGTMNISMHNYLEGSVIIKIGNEEKTIQIVGREHINRAIQGDVIAVQILPKSQWKAAISEIVEEDEVENDGIKKENTNMDIDYVPDEDLLPTGRVIGIIKRNWRPLCGSIDHSSVKESSLPGQLQAVFFWAMDKRIPKIRIRTRQAKDLLGKRVVVSIDSWTKDSRYPAGHYVRTLGDTGDRVTETEVLLLEYDVPFAPFSAKVLSYLPEEGDQWLVKDSIHLENRTDFRHLDVCSIDPPGCTDIDDALHALKLPNGNYQVGVHIADVSHFVKPDNAMDLEAQRRGTTVYLVDKRIDMLPGLLGTNLCSLRSNIDRLAFSCIWEMTPDAQVVNVNFMKSVIRSKASLTYDEAQARLVDPKMNDAVSAGIKTLNGLAKKLRARRMDGGALTLASPEVRFRMENDSQDPVDVEMKELKDTNALVEEFMLLANIHVAKAIHNRFPDSSMLRRHPKPPANNFEQLIKALEKRGFTLDPTTSRTLSDSLDNATTEDPYFNKLVRIMTTRCMMQAVYFSSGTTVEHDFWHYGLATPIYTHFTSPIRRYADLVVHRLLACCIGYESHFPSSLTDLLKVKEMADGISRFT